MEKVSQYGATPEYNSMKDYMNLASDSSYKYEKCRNMEQLQNTTVKKAISRVL